jgi:hypothetical protein
VIPKIAPGSNHAVPLLGPAMQIIADVNPAPVNDIRELLVDVLTRICLHATPPYRRPTGRPPQSQSAMPHQDRGLSIVGLIAACHLQSAFLFAAATGNRTCLNATGMSSRVSPYIAVICLQRAIVIDGSENPPAVDRSPVKYRRGPEKIPILAICISQPMRVIAPPVDFCGLYNQGLSGNGSIFLLEKVCRVISLDERIRGVNDSDAGAPCERKHDAQGSPLDIGTAHLLVRA